METVKKYNTIPELVKAELAGEIGRKEYEVMVQAMILKAQQDAEKRAAAKPAVRKKPTKSGIVGHLTEALIHGWEELPALPAGIKPLGLTEDIRSAIVGSPNPSVAVRLLNASGLLKEVVRLDMSTFGTGLSKVRVVTDKKAGLLSTDEMPREDSLILVSAQNAIDAGKGMAPQRLSDGTTISVGKKGLAVTFWKPGQGVLDSHPMQKHLQLPA